MENENIKMYTILNEWGDKFTFEMVKLDKKTSYSLYEILDDESKLLYNVIDDDGEIKFSEKLGKKFIYFDFNTLRLFLNMINEVDEKMFEKFDVFSKKFNL